MYLCLNSIRAMLKLQTLGKLESEVARNNSG